MQKDKLVRDGMETGRLLADSVYASIKHPMATGAEGALETQLLDIAKEFPDLEIYIYDFAGKVTYSSHPETRRKDLGALGISPEVSALVSRSLDGSQAEQKVSLETGAGGQRITVISPILNEPACYHCHGTSRKVLGGLMVRRDAGPLFAYLNRIGKFTTAGSLLGALLLAGTLGTLLTLVVTRPVSRIAAGIRRLAEGDLSVQLRHRSRDELGMLAESVNELSANFRDTIHQARETAYRVSEGTSSQAASIEETSASLEEITAMIRQGAEKCGEADSMMRDNDEKLVQANKVMKECIASFDQIVATTETMAGIIKDIDEIAFQTNLLALNAAVEAARAGEAGQGFAVVADEVRSLARRASEAAKSTGDLIRTAQLKTQEGRSLVQKTDAAYREVAIQARKVSQLIKDVAASGQEQSLGVEQISRAMHELEQVIQSFTTVTDQLTQMMDFFRTNGEQSGIDSVPALPPGEDRADSHHEKDLKEGRSVF